MAKNANPGNPTPKRRSTAGAKAKQALKDARSSYRKKMKEMKEKQVPEAAMNVGIATLAAVPAGALCGLVPDTYKVDMMGESYEVPTRAITEGVITVGSLVGTVGSALAGFRGGIYFFGGGFSTGSAFLVARGVNWAREEGMKAWGNNAQQPQAPALAA